MHVLVYVHGQRSDPELRPVLEIGRIDSSIQVDFSMDRTGHPLSGYSLYLPPDES